MVDNIIERLDEASDKCFGAVVMFLQAFDEDSSKKGGFGSGFLLEHQNKQFVVTAHHVAESIAARDTVMRTANGSVIISNLEFFSDLEADVSVAEIGPTLARGSISQVQTVPVAPPPARYVPTEVGLFMGHPATANRINPRATQNEFKVFSISGSKITQPTKASNLKSPIYYSFERNKMIPGRNRPAGSRSAPEPYGMSGGPVFQVFLDPINPDFYLVIGGVAAEWHSANSYLVAADIADVWKLIAHAFAADARL